jgi:hypothetical protein
VPRLKKVFKKTLKMARVAKILHFSTTLSVDVVAQRLSTVVVTTG